VPFLSGIHGERDGVKRVMGGYPMSMFCEGSQKISGPSLKKSGSIRKSLKVKGMRTIAKGQRIKDKECWRLEVRGSLH
jgi:hypothetical protein